MYRVSYASHSPRLTCTTCNQQLRSGDVYLQAYDTQRHIGCVSGMEVVRLLHSVCKGHSLSHLPGLSSLEAADRDHVEGLFNALLLSTPMNATARRRMALAQQQQEEDEQRRRLNQPSRQPSNDAMMMESSPDSSVSPPLPVNLDLTSPSPIHFHQSTSPFGMNSSISSSTAAVPSSFASSSSLPLSVPTLSSTPSGLACYLSTLSCSTPTHTQMQLSNGGSGSGSGNGHENGVLTPQLHNHPLAHSRQVSHSHSSSRATSPGMTLTQPMPPNNQLAIPIMHSSPPNMQQAIYAVPTPTQQQPMSGFPFAAAPSSTVTLTHSSTYPATSSSSVAPSSHSSFSRPHGTSRSKRKMHESDRIAEEVESQMQMSTDGDEWMDGETSTKKRRMHMPANHATASASSFASSSHHPSHSSMSMSRIGYLATQTPG